MPAATLNALAAFSQTQSSWDTLEKASNGGFYFRPSDLEPDVATRFRIVSPPSQGCFYYDRDNKVKKLKEFPAKTPIDIAPPGVYGEQKVRALLIFLVWDYEQSSIRLAQVEQAGIRNGLYKLKESYKDLTAFDVMFTKTVTKDKNGKDRPNYSVAMDKSSLNKFPEIEAVLAELTKLGQYNLENYWVDEKIFANSGDSESQDSAPVIDEHGMVVPTEADPLPPEKSIKEMVLTNAQAAGYKGKQLRDWANELGLSTELSPSEYGTLMAYMCTIWAESQGMDGATAHSVANQIVWTMDNAFEAFKNALANVGKTEPAIAPEDDEDEF